jgi:hypothetical protein
MALNGDIAAPLVLSWLEMTIPKASAFILLIVAGCRYHYKTHGLHPGYE